MSVVSSGQLAWDSRAWKERRRRRRSSKSCACGDCSVQSRQVNRHPISLYHASCIALIKLQMLKVTVSVSQRSSRLLLFVINYEEGPY